MGSDGRSGTIPGPTYPGVPDDKNLQLIFQCSDANYSYKLQHMRMERVLASITQSEGALNAVQ